MQQRQFKPFDSVSALTLGGGGLGQVWGETSREEAVATVNLAIEKGITHLDVAPMYGKGEAERVVGEVFKGKDLGDVKITTKCNSCTYRLSIYRWESDTLYDIVENPSRILCIRKQ